MQIFYFRKIKKMLDKEHSDTFENINNLALMLNRQGSYDETKRIHRQILMLKKRAARIDQWQ